MKKIAVDAMGGDHAPQAIIEGVNRAIATYSDIVIRLYGDEEKIRPLLKDSDRVEIVHTTEKIHSDDEPVRSIRKKKDASMVLAAHAVKDGEVDAMLSAGNTGALLAAGIFIVGRIKNIERPGLMSSIPTANGLGFDMLDLGANAENSAKQLHQYAILGSFYAQHVRGLQTPRIGLLNNGTEASKGDPIRKAAYDLLSNDASIHFVGNVEARELLNGVADVVVTDGFTGNAVLKTMEGTAISLLGQLKTAIEGGGLRSKLGYLFLRKSFRSLKQSMDYSEAGGAVLFGLKAPVVKAHGSSDDSAIFNAIRQVRLMLETDVVQKSVDYFQTEGDE
ncbi:phosphate acyltransferase PlsX [Streptococcus sp. DD13]|uniref:phosphate acyltransferase PlsX n=1 Tax=Streptococcus sp. DD13 TaxID=1777881 RepID=UPI000795DCD6|nr:phosphate acyltransferase PlsX [Streptococcus sp. DD13]KXT77261.1 Phosphate:acyl-ACP acyltransferase PlsX [Streptococcus sp. DD13]